MPEKNAMRGLLQFGDVIFLFDNKVVDNETLAFHSVFAHIELKHIAHGVLFAQSYAVEIEEINSNLSSKIHFDEIGRASCRERV